MNSARICSRMERETEETLAVGEPRANGVSHPHCDSGRCPGGAVAPLGLKKEKVTQLHERKFSISVAGHWSVVVAGRVGAGVSGDSVARVWYDSAGRRHAAAIGSLGG